MTVQLIRSACASQRRVLQNAASVSQQGFRFSPWRKRSGDFYLIRSASRFAYPQGMRAFEDDFTETPEYPPIVPEERKLNDLQKQYLTKLKEWESEVRNGKTVEDKLIAMNVRRKYGWRVFTLKEDSFQYNSLPYYQYITRTHMMPIGELPSWYSDPIVEEQAQSYCEQLRDPVRDAVQFELYSTNKKFVTDPELETRDRAVQEANNVLYQVHRLLQAVLSQEVSHLKDCRVDHEPKVEAFWSCAGLVAPSSVELRRERKVKKCEELKKKFRDTGARVEYYAKVGDPIEKNFQYITSSMMQLRTEEPIRNFVEQSSELCQKGEQIPDRFSHSDTNYNSKSTIRMATFLPGHWSGDSFRSSLLSVHPQHHLVEPHRIRDEWKAHFDADQDSALDSQAVLSCFSRMLAQSMYFGFDQFSDLDYPFSTQHISTDGLYWAFYAYQLNTIGLGERQMPKNKLQNICWRTANRPLLSQDGSVDDEILKTLIKFYLNPPTTPVSPKGEDVMPYLSEKMEDIDDEYRRRFLFRNVRDMYSHKYQQYGATERIPELYDWERIYKVYFQEFPMDARRRFFELPKPLPGSDPYNEPYRLRNPLSMPKALFRYRRELREKKEQEELEAAQLAEKRKFIKDVTQEEEFKD